MLMLVSFSANFGVSFERIFDVISLQPLPEQANFLGFWSMSEAHLAGKILRVKILDVRFRWSTKTPQIFWDWKLFNKCDAQKRHLWLRVSEFYVLIEPDFVCKSTRDRYSLSMSMPRLSSKVSAILKIRRLGSFRLMSCGK